MTKELDEFRKRIDRVDKQLVELLNERAKVVVEVVCGADVLGIEKANLEVPFQVVGGWRPKNERAQTTAVEMPECDRESQSEVPA